MPTIRELQIAKKTHEDKIVGYQTRIDLMECSKLPIKQMQLSNLKGSVRVNAIEISKIDEEIAQLRQARLTKKK